MLNHAAPNYKNSRPLVITLWVSFSHDRTVGERIRKWRLEQGLFQKGLAKMVCFSEMTIVNWERRGTRLAKKNLEELQKFLKIEQSSL